jgi:hypothetical protein
MSKLPIILIITSWEIKRTMSKLPIILIITSCEIKRTMSKLLIYWKYNINSRHNTTNISWM